MSSPECDRTTIFTGNPVILISADLPGCGSSSLAQGLDEALKSSLGVDPYVCYVGQEIRKLLDVRTDEELHAKLAEINDPHSFDPAIYGALPEDRPCIIEGKLATTAGPKFIEATDRPILSVNLTSTPLFSTKRVLQRDGRPLESVFGEEPDQVIIDQFKRVMERSGYDKGLKKVLGGVAVEGEVTRAIEVLYDTSKLSVEEVVNDILGTSDYADHVPEWEYAALNKTLKTLTMVGFDLRRTMNPQDKVHFDHQLESITYNIDRLHINLNAHGLEQIRADLKKGITDCWYGLMLKRTPRFFIDQKTDEVVYDTESHSWSPEYYKIAEGWPTLSRMLKDKVVLDPFAGAGTLMNLLVARDIPKAALYSDICYPGGKPVNGSGYWYDPELNTQASQLLFDDLPSWYKPDFSPSKGFITTDARKLPFKDNAVDYVFADPPYGKNLDSPGIGILIGCLKEFQRIAREGSILMVPLQWLKDIEASGTHVEQLTGDVSAGKSNFPVCYILIKNEKTPASSTLDLRDKKPLKAYQSSLNI